MIKCHFAHTNKRNYVPQLAAAEVWERFMRRVKQHLSLRHCRGPLQVREHRTQCQRQAHAEANEEGAEESLDTTTCYDMAKMTRESENILEWVYTNHTDIVVKVCHTIYRCTYWRHTELLQDFVPQLKDYILTWLLGKEYNRDKQEYIHAERNEVLIQDNWIYYHKTLWVNYTSYDLRRQQSIINPTSHPDIMVLSCEDGMDAHPYWYTRVIKIFHLLVCYRSSAYQDEHAPMEPKHMDVLWVRWFGLNMDGWRGWSKKCLHSVLFISQDEPGPFGFLDPAQVIWGVHLIPNFQQGQMDSRLPPSIMQLKGDCDEDWESFYVNL